MDSSLSTLQVVGASVIVGLLVLFVSLKLSKSDRRKDAKKLPPGPRPWPIVGNIPLLSPLIHQDFKKLSDIYGPIFHLRFGSVDGIVISSPRLAEEVLKTKDMNFVARAKSSFGEIIAYDHSSCGLSSYGPYWRHARKLYTLQLMTVKRIRQFEKERSAELLRAVDFIIDGCNDGKSICIDKVLWTLISNNICRMTFSKTYYGDNARTASATESSQFEQTIKEMSRLMTVPVLGDFIPLLRNFDIGGYKKEFKEFSAQMDQILEAAIEEHLIQHKRRKKTNADGKGDNQQDLLDVLLTTPSSDNENPLTREQVKALLLEVLAAGTDTQVATLNWTLRELLKNPSVVLRAQEELDNVVGNQRLVQEADLPHLPYIQAIVNESFRLHASVPLLVPRQASEASLLAEKYYIPKNAQVFINVWAMGRDPSLWENPLEFNPERFLNTAIEHRSGQVFKFLPFGSGRRMCPGKSLALIVVEYSLAVLLQACDWALPRGVKPEDLDMREAPGVSAPPVVPLEVRASPRLPLSVIFAAQ